jgi:membrane protein CcdC involved in cytochrome C biogenesis
MTTALDLGTIMDAYAMLIGDPMLIGMFILALSGIVSVRLGVSTPFLLTTGLVLMYLMSAYLPTGLFLISLFVVGVVFFFALKKIDSNF